MITCDKFLDCAKRILAKRSIPFPEEECRTAISRAYYSLYHQTLETTKNQYSHDLINTIERYKKRRLTRNEKIRLNSLDPTFLKNLNFHNLLPKTLTRIGERGKAVSFKNFRDLRNQADYDLKRGFPKVDAITFVNAIESLFNQVKTL